MCGAFLTFCGSIRWPLMRSRTGCICLTCIHCVFSHVSSNCLHESMHSCTGCICLTFLRCGFSNVSSYRLPERIHNHIGCICLTFLHCVFSDASSNCPPERMHSHSIGYICLTFICPLSLSLEPDWIQIRRCAKHIWEYEAKNLRNCHQK